MKTEIEIPEGITLSIDKGILVIKGKKGEVRRSFINPEIQMKTEDNKIIFESKNATKRQKKMHNTFKAHIKNLFRGVSEGHKYVLKICSGHFPMNVSINGKELIIKNFLGEKVPRKLKLKDGSEIKIDGDKIIIESVNKELAGQTAADIEKLTRIKGRDLRIFQDGIYIIEKDGKEM